ncbi:DUF6262 family protein [Pseudarthrobacter sp. BIM B-2242]|uniref:DUF6262 family protein n=1 Tax=Pseudarthrobacter sp. BIM B-2242 TaxID=2772401 RepID=UPI00168B8C28|nr:DUF6262 family protein [Pseudarthrobacter sp. BIM B-2242]QOD03047.1 transposase [Pseudarthrobacter sp. BIM B-2242]QOD05241.1 transposase [Pseudarthrobacter sp. BIM B-2242]
MNRPDNSRHLIKAAQQRAALTRSKAVQALRALHADGRPITFDAVARYARVSRSWLYTQPDLRAEIEHLRQNQASAEPTQESPAQRASEASLRQRLEAANDRIRRLNDENQRLRQQLAHALGQRRQSP